MASEEKANVIRRSCRGRIGVDVNAKTDSGCFVDDELEKQTLGEKLPTAKKDDLKIANSEIQDTSYIPLLTRSTQIEADSNSVPQNVVGGKEMSRENESTNNNGGLESDEDIDRSEENNEPREDFYCLYYSDSPNGSLTRRKEKSPTVSCDQGDKDIGAGAKIEDSQRVLQASELRFCQRPLPVAPKPKGTTKNQYHSNINVKDPILAELEMLGSAVGRDFTSVEADKDDVSLLSNAVRKLHVAQTPQECFERLDDIQSALNENIPDTLERSKAKIKKHASRRKSLPEENKAGNTGEVQKSKEKEKSSQTKNLNNSGKKAESPKSGKGRFEPIKVSRTEFQSLNSMREDSHHKRSHMNSDSVKPVSTKPETYRPKKPEVPKGLSERSGSKKTNTKKDQKPLTPPKGGKPSIRKPITSNGSKDVSKKQERLELRSNRGRRRGDLSSIPENAVMDEKKERRRSDEVIPLAKGEEDLSSEEESNDLDYDLVADHSSPSVCPVEEENIKQAPSQSPTSTEEVSTVSTPRTYLTNPSKHASENSASLKVCTNIVYNGTSERGTTLSSNLVREEKNTASDRAKDLKNLQTQFFKQQGDFHNYRGRDQTLSDGWTSESTAEYSSECSENDADDEGDKRAEHSLTDNREAYDEPVDIVDMTFGSQVDNPFGGETSYNYTEEYFQQPERKSFIEVGNSVPTYHYPARSQDQFEDSDEFSFQRGPDSQDTTKSPAIYEFLEEAELGPYRAPAHTNPEFPSVDVDPRVPRQKLKRNTIEEQFQHTVLQKPKKVHQEESPDPSGFMTVQDIKRLIFQGRKPTVPRATSFCGIPSSPTWDTQGQETFQRRSWSGYGVQQQKEPGVDPLVRNFPQKSLSSHRPPKGKINKSPYVRTVSQRSNSQFGYNSDTHLNAVNEEEREYLARSLSFGRTPLQRRSYSLETYHSDNSLSDGANVVPAQPTRPHLLIRSASDCSSNYSQGQSYTCGILHGTTETPSNRRPGIPQYIDAEELELLVSPHSRYTGGRDDVLTVPLQYHVNSHVPQYQILQNQPNDASFSQDPSERLRIQTIRKASQPRRDSESDDFVSIGLPERSELEPSIQQLKLGVTKLPNQKTLSERFSEVPQRVSLEELAEKLNLGSDSEDDVDYVSIVEKPDSEFGAELEFDNGDYFDDKNMIVGEAMRLKKVLGAVSEQDPELETLVKATTDPKLPKTPQTVYTATPSKISHKQANEALVFQRPPPYHGARRKSTETSVSDYSCSSPIIDIPPLYESETESHTERIKSEEKLKVVLPHDQTKNHVQVLGWKNSEPRQYSTDKAISADELLKLLLNASRGNLEKSTLHSSESKPQHLVQNVHFPKHPTKAASTGNIHSDGPFPGHISQLYDNSDLHSAKSSINGRRQELRRPTCHKSEECIRKKQYLNSPYGVLQARMIGSECNTKKHTKRVFEEEVDCMKTKHSSSGEISTSGSSIDDVIDKKEGLTCVSFIGYEKTKELETLPRVKFSSQRKRRKEKTGYLSDQDVPTVVVNSGDSNLTLEKSSEDLNDENMSTYELRGVQNSKASDAQEDKLLSSNEKASRGIQDSRNMNGYNGPVEVVDLRYYHDNENKCLERIENIDHVLNELPHDDVPSPNSVNVFIDYNNKNVMKITTSTPKIHHAKLVTPQAISPVPYEEDNKISFPHGNGSSFGEEEFPPKYENSPSSDRSSSVYSSDDEKFFGSSDTVVFVDKMDENSSVKPNVDNTTLLAEDQEPSTSNGDYCIYDDDAEKAQVYSTRIDSLLQEVRSSLNLDSIGSDLLEQAMERVKDKLSPRSSTNQDRIGITMEAFVALHQADELQAIINEIKGELWILQQENTLLKEKVVSLQHSGACSTSESTEDSLTESAERIDSIRRQIAAVAATRQKASESEDNELITVDVFLRGYGRPVGLKHAKKTDIKLGTVKVQGGTDWRGVYDAAKTTFLDHVKRIDPCSCLGLGSTSMYGAQIGATMLTPETLRRKNPRVEISRKLNSCVIQLKDGMTESFDTLVYDTLIPRPIVEGFVHQILENRFMVLCGAAGLGKTFLAMKLAEHLAQRFGSKNEFPVLSLAVGQTGRKELKRTLANLMKSDISSSSSVVPVVVVLDQLDSLASLADIFDPKQLEGNRNSPFIIGVRNKSKKGPFSSKDLAVYKYFRWIQMSVHDRYVLGLLERFLRRKLSCIDDAENEEDLLDLFLWLTQVWQKINQILQSYVDVEVTIGPSVFYSCPMDMHAAEGWFANVWNYTLIPYLHQNLRNSSKIYERNVPWECPTKWVIMRWPWNRENSKVLATLKKLRQVDVVLNRNFLEFTKGDSKAPHPKTRKLLSKTLVSQSPSKAGSLESWSTADWDAVSLTSEVDSIASSSTL